MISMKRMQNKTSADIKMCTNKNYDRNSFFIYRASISSMREKYYYSLDMYRHITSNVNKTKEETNECQSLFRQKIVDKINKKQNEIDLFGKRPSEIESSIYQLKQQIAKLEEDIRECRGIMVRETNESAKTLIIRDYSRVLD